MPKVALKPIAAEIENGMSRRVSAEIRRDGDGDEHVGAQEIARIVELDPRGRRAGRWIEGGVHRADTSLEGRMTWDRVSTAAGLPAFTRAVSGP
jgi:hypothetical protein